MYFSKLPEGYPGAGGDIILTLAGCEADMIMEARIMSGDGILGIKRFRGQTQHDIDAACYLRGTVEVEPFLTATRSGFVEMPERLPRFSVAATQYPAAEDGPGDGSVWVDSGPLYYTPGAVDSPPKTVLTEIDRAFTIASGETFELPLITEEKAVRAVVRVYTPEFTHEVSYANAGDNEVGLYLL